MLQNAYFVLFSCKNRSRYSRKRATFILDCALACAAGRCTRRCPDLRDSEGRRTPPWLPLARSPGRVHRRKNLPTTIFLATNHQNKSVEQWFKLAKKCEKIDENFLNYWGLSGAKACKSCRSRQELSNEYLLAKFGVDTAENEPF